MDNLKLMTLLLISFFLVGCRPDLNDLKDLDVVLGEALTEDNVQRRGAEGEQLIYDVNKQTPFTGWVKDFFDNGQIRALYEVKDGKVRGQFIDWYQNGQKRVESKIGKNEHVLSAKSWFPDGNKCLETNINNGNGILVLYDENGYEFSRCKFEDGERVSSYVPIQETRGIMSELINHLETFKMLGRRGYPTENQGLHALVTRPSTPPIPKDWLKGLMEVPNDGWGRKLRYKITEIGFEITSSGPDGIFDTYDDIIEGY